MNDANFAAWVSNLCRQVLAENPELIVRKARDSRDLDFTSVPMVVPISDELGLDLCLV